MSIDASGAGGFRVVIVGGGQAASECAAQLRQNGLVGEITIISEESHLPYQRPPLSKAFLAGEVDVEHLYIRADAAYGALSIAIRTGVAASAINRHERTISMVDGDILKYDKLVIATGGRARHMRVPGAELGNIFYLRTIDDVQLLRGAFTPGKRLTIVGGGYVGLEVAAVAIRLGLVVTVLEGAPRVLARVTAPEMSAFYERMHRAEGVDIRTGAVVSGFVAAANGSDVGSVECGEGPPIESDLVLIGIGLIPNTDLAEVAGLVVDNGIVVDGMGCTTDAHIHAIGDCAQHAHHGFLGRKVRLESVPNALEQARVVACVITGRPAPAATAPWFWSDQYKLKLQMVRISEGYEHVVMRGSMDTASFIAFYLHDGRVIAADAVNRAADFMIAKRLVAERRSVSASVLSDETRPLNALLRPAA